MESQKDQLKPITVTVNRAMSLSGVGRTKIYELINNGRLKTVTIGRRRLVVYASLEALAQGECDAAA